MNKFISIRIVCFLFVAHVKGQSTGWSSWADCAESDGCFRRRIFTCDDGEGFDCLDEANGAFEQIAVNCNASLECLKNVTETFQTPEVCIVSM